MHTEPRGAVPVSIIVIHTNEGPEGNRSAQGLSHYLDTIQAGYHKVGDNAECIVKATDDKIVWGAGGVNSRAVHYACVGYASQSDAQWHDAYSSSELKIAASHVAIWCIKHNIPVRRLSPQQLLTGTMAGIVGHGDVSAVYPESMGHSDPGSAFPWTEFLALVAKAATPVEKVHPQHKPPVVPVGGLAADCDCPSGGAWGVTPDGHVYTFGHAPYLGAPHGQLYWGKREAARIVAINYGNVLRKKWGYRVVPTSGEPGYDFKPK